jgi:nitric oxide reductase large subunit
MDSGVIVGIVTLLVLIGIMLWLYSIGKDYESGKKNKRK